MRISIKRQPLFGREREGGASLREAASLAYSHWFYSSGEGVWGRGASLREAASPPESPYRCLFEREREGGGFSSEKPQTVDKVVNGLFKWKKARKRQSNVE